MPRLAKLLFDSAAQSSLPGMRAIAGGERSMLFGVDGLTLDMMVFESAGLSVVHGQLVSTADECGIPNAKVQLGEDGAIVETDHFGQFSLSTMDALDAQVLTAMTDELELACPLPTKGAA